MSIESETRVNDPIIIETETTTCVVCDTRTSDFSRHLPFCGPICEYCFDKIRTLQETNESKRRQLDSVPPNVAKKIEKILEDANVKSKE